MAAKLIQPKFESVDDAVQYLDKHWRKITGTPKSTINEEGHWPEGAEEFIESCGFSDQFDDAWMLYHE